jgi:gamma-glutamylcysteine synthetase
MKSQRLIGVEIEYPVVDTKNMTALSQKKFRAVWKQMEKMGWELMSDPVTGYATGVSRSVEIPGHGSFSQSVSTDTGPILEIAAYPETNIKDLYFQVDELKAVLDSLMADVNGKILSVGIHPFLNDSKKEYYEYRTPRSAYDYAIKQRGWPHNKIVNIAATQENIDVPKKDALKAIRVMTRLCGLMIFAHRYAPDIHNGGNSLCIRPQKWLESVSSKNPKFEADKRKVNIPDNEILNWNDYFNLLWNDAPMFLLGTKKHGLFYIPEHPTFLDFLKKPEWDGVDLHGKKVKIIPDIDHINCTDWTYFGLCRPRWKLNNNVRVVDMIKAINDSYVEEFFLKNLNKVFIENRCNATSMWPFELSSTTFVLGLLENLEKAETFTSQHNYDFWKKVFSLSQTTKLKEAYIGDVRMLDLLYAIIDIAHEGLELRGQNEENFMALTETTANTGKSPSELLLDSYKKNSIQTIQQLINLQ